VFIATEYGQSNVVKDKEERRTPKREHRGRKEKMRKMRERERIFEKIEGEKERERNDEGKTRKN